MCNSHGDECDVNSAECKDKTIEGLFGALQEIVEALDQGEINDAYEVCFSWLTEGA